MAHELLALVPKLVKHLVERGAVWAYFHVCELVEHGVEEMLVRVEGAFPNVNHSIGHPAGNMKSDRAAYRKNLSKIALLI